MFGKELGEDGKPPTMITHDGFDERGNLLKESKCLVGSWVIPQVFVGEYPYVGRHEWTRG